MVKVMANLKSVGFTLWFKNRMDNEMAAVHDIARVISVHKDSYVVTNGNSDIFAEITGNLSYSANSAADLPTTGDWVYVDFYDDDTLAIIHGIFPRQTLLKGKPQVNRWTFS